MAWQKDEKFRSLGEILHADGVCFECPTDSAKFEEDDGDNREHVKIVQFPGVRGKYEDYVHASIQRSTER